MFCDVTAVLLTISVKLASWDVSEQCPNIIFVDVYKMWSLYHIDSYIFSGCNGDEFVETFIQ